MANGQGFPLGTVNARRTCHQGIGAELQTELGHALLARRIGKQDEDRLVLEQTYTLSDFHFRHGRLYGDNRIAGTPVHFYKAELRYEHPCGFMADRMLSGTSADTRLLEVFFEVKNLTDKIYAATVEPVGNPRTEGARSFNPGNGRSLYSGISWVW